MNYPDQLDRLRLDSRRWNRMMYIMVLTLVFVAFVPGSFLMLSRPRGMGTPLNLYTVYLYGLGCVTCAAGFLMGLRGRLVFFFDESVGIEGTGSLNIRRFLGLAVVVYGFYLVGWSSGLRDQNSIDPGMMKEDFLAKTALALAGWAALYVLRKFALAKGVRKSIESMESKSGRNGVVVWAGGESLGKSIEWVVPK